MAPPGDSGSVVTFSHRKVVVTLGVHGAPDLAAGDTGVMYRPEELEITLHHLTGQVPLVSAVKLSGHRLDGTGRTAEQCWYGSALLDLTEDESVPVWARRAAASHARAQARRPPRQPPPRRSPPSPE